MLEEEKEGHSSWNQVGKGDVSGGQIAQGLLNHNSKLGFYSNFSRKPLEVFFFFLISPIFFFLTSLLGYNCFTMVC